MGRRVVILGGGVAGMSAAHELAKRKFEVEVLEYRAIPGGKARSMPVPTPRSRTRPRLPAEHGFRFFPGFYRYLPQTLGEIPCTSPGCPPGHMVADHLASTSCMQMARANDGPALFDFDTPGPPITGVYTALKFIFDYRSELQIPGKLFGFFVFKVLKLMARKDEWFTKFEEQGWYEYSGAAGRWKDNSIYEKYLATGVTRTMVAARASDISARTAGCTMVKLIEALTRADEQADRVLDGPTNDVWIDPWLAHLRANGVTYRLGHEATRIHLDTDGAVEKVTVKGPDGEEEVTGDYFIAALPAEVMKCLVTPEMRDGRSGARDPRPTKTSWMNGVMIYLREPLQRQVHGHSIYIDSPWALTSICQQQFWQRRLAGMGDGQVRDILSVDVSDWESESNGKIAKRSSRKQIVGEVLAQLRAHLDHDPKQALRDDNIRTCFVDPDITFENPRTDKACGKRRATAAQHPEVLAVQADGEDQDPEPVSRVGLRADRYGSGDDGRRQRGRPPRGQRDLQTVRRRRRPDAPGVEPSADRRCLRRSVTLPALAPTVGRAGHRHRRARSRGAPLRESRGTGGGPHPDRRGDFPTGRARGCVVARRA